MTDRPEPLHFDLPADARHATALLDAIFASAPVGLGFWDREFRFVRVNDRLAEINGIPAAEHIGRTPAELLPGIAGVEELMARWREMLRTGEPLLGVEIVGETPASPGAVRSWTEDFFPVRVAGEIVGLAAVVVETTERRRQEAALREADRRKDEFLAMLAHELRNPLGAIGNAVALLSRARADDPLLDTSREVLDRQVRHLARLVDDLLDVARIGQDKFGLQRRPMDFVDAVRQGVETVAALAESRGIQLRLRLPSEGLAVDGDPVRLAQVVANLLHNAAKFSAEGGRVEVDLVAVHERAAELVVRDEGVGIAPELLPRVFELFAQGESGTDRAGGGLGIGLTLVHRIVTMHGGTVAVASEGPGRGAEFRVRLPLAEAATPGAASGGTPSGAAARGLRVLIVDDNPDVLTSLAMLLEIDGHAVTTAHDSASALEAAVEFAPDVVLLDLGLPGVDGYATARRLREQPGGAGRLLIAVTGYGQPEDVARGRAAGFDHHLLKPVDFARLDALLAQAARARRADCAV